MSLYLNLTRDRVAVLAALAAPLALAAVLVPFRASFPNTDAALAMILVVVAVAANGYRLAGILAAVSAAVWFDFFLTRPYEQFTINQRNDIETTVLLLVIDGSVTVAHRTWDVDVEGFPPGTDVELLVESGGVFQGRFLMTPLPGARPTSEQRLLAVALADQVGAALATSHHPVDRG